MDKRDISIIEDEVLDARERRLKCIRPQKEKDSYRSEFSDYYLLLCNNNGLKKELEDIIWIHLVSIKHNKPDLFDKGIKHFGYKI